MIKFPGGLWKGNLTPHWLWEYSHSVQDLRRWSKRQKELRCNSFKIDWEFSVWWGPHHSGIDRCGSGIDPCGQAKYPFLDIFPGLGGLHLFRRFFLSRAPFFSGTRCNNVRCWPFAVLVGSSRFSDAFSWFLMWFSFGIGINSWALILLIDSKCREDWLAWIAHTLWWMTKVVVLCGQMFAIDIKISNAVQMASMCSHSLVWFHW